MLKGKRGRVHQHVSWGEWRIFELPRWKDLPPHSCLTAGRIPFLWLGHSGWLPLARRVLKIHCLSLNSTNFICSRWFTWESFPKISLFHHQYISSLAPFFFRAWKMLNPATRIQLQRGGLARETAFVTLAFPNPAQHLTAFQELLEKPSKRNMCPPRAAALLLS